MPNVRHSSPSTDPIISFITKAVDGIDGGAATHVAVKSLDPRLTIRAESSNSLLLYYHSRLGAIRIFAFFAFRELFSTFYFLASVLSARSKKREYNSEGLRLKFSALEKIDDLLSLIPDLKDGLRPAVLNLWRVVDQF